MRKQFVFALALSAPFASPAAAQTYPEQWTVTPIGPGPAGTVVVIASMDFASGPCLGCDPPNPCGITGGPAALLDVTPCPLGETCSGGTYYKGFSNPGTLTDTLTLECGVTYTFTGGAMYDLGNLVMVGYPPTQVCMSECSCVYGFVSTQFVFGATPARGMRWGRLKVIYR